MAGLQNKLKVLENENSQKNEELTRMNDGYHDLMSQLD